jgi:hypothetical protein
MSARPRKTRQDGNDTGDGILSLAEALGERLGQSLGRVSRDLRGTTKFPPGEGDPTVDAAVERANELVTQAERGILHYATTAYLTVSRIAARAREEYEDIAAERQHASRAQTPGGKKSRQHAAKE